MFAAYVYQGKRVLGGSTTSLRDVRGKSNYQDYSKLIHQLAILGLGHNS